MCLASLHLGRTGSDTKFASGCHRMTAGRAGDGASVDYVRALHALITTVVDTAAMAPPPTASLWEGLKRTAGSSKEDKYFTSLLGWLAFKRATGAHTRRTRMRVQRSFAKRGRVHSSGCKLHGPG